jgi:hypothetical protein
LADLLEHPARDAAARARIGVENKFVGHDRSSLVLLMARSIADAADLCTRDAAARRDAPNRARAADSRCRSR